MRFCCTFAVNLTKFMFQRGPKIDLESQVSRYIQEQGLPGKDSSALVGVSGGADSIALLTLLLRLGYRCVAAHCDFHLRGAEAERDREWVEHYCRKLGLEPIVVHFDVATYCREHKGVSVEMACRELRYAWFEQLRRKRGLDFIAVAHHRDDNIETFLLNATRGTGIAGLKAMTPLAGHIVRPLLGVTRKQIEDYLRSMGIEWVTDSSNADCEYRRNALRNIAVPALARTAPSALDGIATTIENVRRNHSLYVELIEREKRQLIKGKTIDTERLLAMDSSATLLYEMVRDQGFSYEQCREAIMALRAETPDGSRYFYSTSHLLHVGSDGTLSIEEISERDEGEYQFTLAGIAEARLPLALSAELVNDRQFSPTLVDGKSSIAVDAQAADTPLVLRHWREGDRIQPFGMAGARLLSDVYNDLHLSAHEKRRQWVVTRADGTVLWAIGARASSHYSVKRGGAFYIVSIKR